MSMGAHPQTLKDALALAEVLAKSDLVPKEFRGNAANIVLAFQLGAELGLAPMQALQSIAVINGRPSIWGDGMLALVMSSGKLEDFSETFDAKTNTATCTAKRVGVSRVVTRTFSEADARKAGLWTKQGPWTNYSGRMLQMRARTFTLRDLFADVLRGITSVEEARDIGALDPIPPELVPMPTRKSEAVASESEPEPGTTEAESVDDAPEPAAPAGDLADALGGASDIPTTEWNWQKPVTITEVVEGNTGGAMIGTSRAKTFTRKPDVIAVAKAALANKSSVLMMCEPVPSFAAAPWRVLAIEEA
jgi:hypothetical protein